MLPLPHQKLGAATMKMKELFNSDEIEKKIIDTGKTKWISLAELPNGFHIAVKSGSKTPCKLRLVNERDRGY